MTYELYATHMTESKFRSRNKKPSMSYLNSVKEQVKKGYY